MSTTKLRFLAFSITHKTHSLSLYWTLYLGPQSCFKHISHILVYIAARHYSHTFPSIGYYGILL